MPRDWVPDKGNGQHGTIVSDAMARALAITDDLVALADQRYRVGTTSSGGVFLVERKNPGIALMLNGSRSEIRPALSCAYHAVNGKPPTGAKIDAALLTLEGQAKTAAPEPVFLRVGAAGDRMYLDLGRADGQVVAIDDSGWRVEPGGAVLFRRTALTAELPIPERNKWPINDMMGLLNISAADWDILLGWIVSGFWFDIPHPILLVNGEQGTGKSTAARMVVGLFDPSNVPLQAAPADADDLIMSASGSLGIVIDNVSSITASLSDALCRICTGDGIVRRKLYTDHDLAVLNVRSMVVLTSIDAGAMRGDLGDRLLSIELSPIDPKRRLTEAVVLSSFKDIHAGLLGGLLDTVVAVRNALPRVGKREWPRMADAARIMAALDVVRGTKSLDRFFEQSSRVALDVVDSDLIAEAIIVFMKDRSEWTGGVVDLLAALKKPDDAGRAWPHSTKAMSGRLKRLSPALRQSGIDVIQPGESDRPRNWILRRAAAQQALPII